MLIESKYSGEPATIEVLNFDTIPIATDGTYYEIAFATIKNPSSEVTDVKIGIRIYDGTIQTAWDQFHMFVDSQSETTI